MKLPLGIFQKTAESVNEATTSWKKAATATNQVLTEFKQLRTPRKDATKNTTFKINDYRDTVESVTVAANDLRTLTAEIREFVESDALTKYSSGIERFTNHLTWRIAQLLLLVFVLALVYKLVVRRNSEFRRSA